MIFKLYFVGWKVICNSIQKLMDFLLQTSYEIRRLSRCSSIKNFRLNNQLIVVQSTLITKRDFIKFHRNHRNEI